MRVVIAAALLIQALIRSASAATVGWSSDQLNSLAMANGTTMLNGTTDPAQTTRALLRIGYFTITDSAIASNFASGNTAAITAAFQEFGVPDAVHVGDAYNKNGVWSASSINVNPTFTGQRIHIWAYDTNTAGAATQWGIFTNTSAVNWLFPSDTPLPGSVIVDLSQVPHDSTGLVVGGFAASSPDPNFPTGHPYTLAALVPEPSSVLLSAFGLGVLAARRRRERD